MAFWLARKSLNSLLTQFYFYEQGYMCVCVCYIFTFYKAVRVLHGHVLHGLLAGEEIPEFFLISFLFLWTGVHVLHGHVSLWPFVSRSKRIGAGVNVGWGHAQLPLRSAHGSVDACAPPVFRAGTEKKGYRFSKDSSASSDFMQQHKCSWVLTFEKFVGLRMCTWCRGVCLERARLVVAAWRVRNGWAGGGGRVYSGK